ncbi:MAG: hypothetical protein AAGA30_10150 [Planctomycetota bacterium]
MTELNQPPKETQIGDGRMLFQFISGLILWAIHFTGAFWALIVKKPTTVGTRAYWIDASGNFVMLIALSQNSWYPDKYLFLFSALILCLLFWWHFFSTLRAPGHIHTQCIGGSRFGGSGHTPQMIELMLGFFVGIFFCLFEMVPYGFFIIASAFASSFKEGIIQTRDDFRSVQMADALAEQEYLMNNYNDWKKRNGRA